MHQGIGGFYVIHKGYIAADGHNHQSCAGQVADECFFHHFHQIENNAAGGFIRNDGLDIENEGECQHYKSGQHQNSLRVQFPVEVNSGDGGHQYTEEEGYDWHNLIGSGL